MDRDFLFHPAQAGRAGEDIALQIEAAILNEKFQPGERLPSERELQTQFQTGRGVIREAIRALKQKGLIEIRKGASGGAHVKKVDITNAGESLSLFLKQNHIDANHIAEFRESVDQTITTLAIARADEAEKQELVAETERLRAFFDQPEPDKEELGELDRALNIQLAKMTGNPVFEWVMRALQHGFSSKDYALYEDVEYRQKTIINWCETALHIAANEPLKASASIGLHYALLRKCVATEVEGPHTLVAAEPPDDA